MPTPQDQAERNSAVWIGDDEDEIVVVDKLEPEVLGREAAAEWLERIGRRREARRMRRTGSVSRTRRMLTTPAWLRYGTSRRSEPRPREQARGRSRVTRAGPSGDDDSEPPAASPVRASWRSALYLTARELDALVGQARIRLALMKGWAP
jgi:hypothetical protein